MLIRALVILLAIGGTAVAETPCNTIGEGLLRRQSDNLWSGYYPIERIDGRLFIGGADDFCRGTKCYVTSWRPTVGGPQKFQETADPRPTIQEFISNVETGPWDWRKAPAFHGASPTHPIDGYVAEEPCS
jgi:hypothetical protein